MSEQLKFVETIRKIEPLFRFIGIHIKTGVKKPSDGTKLLCIFVLNHVLLNYTIFGGILYFIDGVKRGEDFFGLTFIAPCIANGILTNLKSISLIYHEKTVDKLMDILKQLERDEDTRTKVPKKEKIVAEDLKFLNTVIKVLNIIYSLLVVTFACGPLVLTALKYRQTNELEFILAFKMVYPVDSNNIKYYPFMFLHQSWSDFISILEIAAADHFFYICCTFIRIHFRLLQYDFVRIIEYRKISAGPFHRDAAFDAKFSDLVKRHQKLIESANLLESICTYSTLVNFMTSSIVICLTGFNVTMMSDKTLIVQFLSFLFMSLMQIFFLCFFADLLSTSSTELSDAIYNCNWYLADSRIGKQLLIVLIRAQNPCKLTAAGYTDVNLNSFMRVLSTAWSYFALIQTMYGN